MVACATLFDLEMRCLDTMPRHQLLEALRERGDCLPGDLLELLDVQAGMGAVAHATTDAKGHYTLNEPGNGPYLIRVNHQGGFCPS